MPEVDKNLCIGCGLCISIEPDVFAIDNDDKAIVFSETTEINKENIQEAIDSCPVNAISW